MLARETIIGRHAAGTFFARTWLGRKASTYMDSAPHSLGALSRLDGCSPSVSG